MKDIVGQHGPLAVNVDATMWHDYLGMCCVCKHPCGVCANTHEGEGEKRILTWSSIICYFLI